ncbi:MAG: hypothetical protein KGL52_14675 [Rhodospirillales bacterium]|nr:hypothetical protein [Rhodospirillales bacterium]
MPDLISFQPAATGPTSSPLINPIPYPATPPMTSAPPRTEAVAYPPRTEAVRRTLHARGGALAADLVFLEVWESQTPADIAATLRAAQIRRANRRLAAEIRAELRRGRPLSETERAALGAGLASDPAGT